MFASGGGEGEGVMCGGSGGLLWGECEGSYIREREGRRVYFYIKLFMTCDCVYRYIIFRSLLHWRAFHPSNTRLLVHLTEAFDRLLTRHKSDADVLLYWLSTTASLLYLFRKELQVRITSTHARARIRTSHYTHPHVRAHTHVRGHLDGVGVGACVIFLCVCVCVRACVCVCVHVCMCVWVLAYVINKGYISWGKSKPYFRVLLREGV